jgi:hypothetical protein
MQIMLIPCNFAIYKVSQDLRSTLQDLIPQVILNQECDIHPGPTHNGYGAVSIYSKLNKAEKKEAHRVFIEKS